MTEYRYFETQERDGVQIIYLANVGSDRDAVAEAGRELLQFAEQYKPPRLLVNFQAVPQLSSLVVGKLLLLVRTIKAQGGHVECCGASEGFQGVLGMLGRSLPFDHADKPEADVIEILKKS
jgi:anti-anti-sigma regulatory factor